MKTLSLIVIPVTFFSSGFGAGLDGAGVVVGSFETTTLFTNIGLNTFGIDVRGTYDLFPTVKVFIYPSLLVTICSSTSMLAGFLTIGMNTFPSTTTYLWIWSVTAETGEKTLPLTLIVVDWIVSLLTGTSLLLKTGLYNSGITWDGI